MPGWSDALKPPMMWRLMKDAASDWSRDRAPRLGAALAYYTVFSLVPFLVVVIAVIGLVFGEVAAQSAILSQIAELVGEQTAAAIKDESFMQAGCCILRNMSCPSRCKKIRNYPSLSQSSS